ncbi:hypothetical protein COLO4_23097 [Corchorus olitorius]|uniref:Cupin type-1 domain-containing protein n=1 Tax=Corchorus olitorius TaxID=93759 RepID=A0A1R3IIC6_9ROSI|nr:hypothetical protein COLO4_23097 [Corchorus olitorius]
MATSKVFASLFLVVALFGFVASDPDLLQDLCVADKTAGIKVNGFPCKEEANVTEADFFFSGLANPAVPAAVIAGFNSQLPGTQSIAATLFAATPAVPDNVLTKAFQIGTKEVNKIKTKLAPKKS